MGIKYKPRVPPPKARSVVSFLCASFLLTHNSPFVIHHSHPYLSLPILFHLFPQILTSFSLQNSSAFSSPHIYTNLYRLRVLLARADLSGDTLQIQIYSSHPLTLAFPTLQLLTSFVLLLLFRRKSCRYFSKILRESLSICGSLSCDLLPFCLH